MDSQTHCQRNIEGEAAGDEPASVPSSSRIVPFRPLKDSDPMPFGPHKDLRMDEVPATYLDYLRDANWLHRWPGVEEYIERNAKAIDQEMEEAEWASVRS
jgi:hypothetical protein